MNDGVVYRRGHFPKVRDIAFEDVMTKFKRDEMNESLGIETVEIATPDLIKLQDFEYLPGTLKDAFESIYNSDFDVETIYTFISFKADAKTYGRHKDDDPVLIVQAIGKMMYQFDDGSACILEPGDSMYIPPTVYHTPKTIMGPRVTLSCLVR